MTMVKKPLVGCILAGGKNTRMKGRKKLLLTCQGKPFYQHISDHLTMAGIEDIYLSVEAKQPYLDLPYPLIEDEIREIGPMGGIYTVLKTMAGEYDAVFFLSCDTPLVSGVLIRKLMIAYEEDPTRLIVAKTPDRIHPLCGIYPITLLSLLEDKIKEGNYRMMQLLKEAGARYLETGAVGELQNINTPQEYHQIQ